MKRVVVTGMGAISALGCAWDSFESALRAGRSGIRYMPDWDRFDRLNTRLGGPVEFETPAHYNRKRIRAMGRVALMATRASEVALEDAGLLGDGLLKSGEVGVSYGSSTGSPDALAEMAAMYISNDMSNINGTTYLRMMPHTTAVNIGVFFGLRGRVYTTSSACTSGSQGVGYAYEAIARGQQVAMVCGGAEELCFTEAAVFDTLYATCTRNAAPHENPRPFDRDRDGLVIGEGACTLVLEEREHALARGATLYAEVVGYGTNSDGGHVTQPTPETMRVAMELALRDARLEPAAIGYVQAHGTATERGDVAESAATRELFGRAVPISSLKGHLGHTLGACGALESWASIAMMNSGWFAPTLNLDHVDERCADLDYIMGAGKALEVEYVMNNNFAFGGVNTSLVFRRTG